MAKGTCGQLYGKNASGGFFANPPEKQPTLADQGIDKHFTDATRRIGELIAEKKAAGKLAKGGRPTKNRVSEKPGLSTLDEQGVDKNLAHAARQLAAVLDGCRTGKKNQPSVTAA